MHLTFENRLHEGSRKNDNFLCIEDSVSTVRAMKKQEIKYVCRDYIRDENIKINAECRSKMVQWGYQTVDFFSMSRNSVYIAMSCLDRFLGKREGQPYLMDNLRYQLACITSLYLAIKTHESVELGVSMLVQLCRGAYNAQQITRTEVIILQALNWEVNPPCPKAFVSNFIAMLPSEVSKSTRLDLLDLICYQNEMVLADYTVGALCLPSSVALASLERAICLCPEISSGLRGSILRSLEESTGCRRCMAKVEYVKRAMEKQSLNTDESCGLPSLLKQRKDSCAARARKKQAYISGHRVSPIGVMER